MIRKYLILLFGLLLLCGSVAAQDAPIVQQASSATFNYRFGNSWNGSACNPIAAGVNSGPCIASAGTPVAVSNISETTGFVVTLTVASSGFAVNNQVPLLGLTTGTWLNGLRVTLTAATPTSITFTDPTFHGLQSSAAEGGYAYFVTLNTFYTYDTKGNVLSKATNLAPGGMACTATTCLTESWTYNANGTVASSTDQNGNALSAPTFACGGLTSQINLPVNSLSMGFTYDTNCVGKILSTLTLAGYSDSATYDSMGRVATSTDEQNNVIQYTYTPTSSESVESFGTTTLDHYTYYTPSTLSTGDQTANGSQWDSVTTTSSWGTNGVVSTVSSSCSIAKNGVCPANGTTTANYDALHRLTSQTDGDGATETLSYTYSSSTCSSGLVGCSITTQVVGPAAPNGTVKTVAEEYNGIGLKVATCLVTAQPQGISCGFGGYSGILTTYFYDALQRPITTTRISSSGSQTHSFTYDNQGRMLTSTYPESGTVQYFYDTPPATPGIACSTILPAGTAAHFYGQLVKTVDANGNTTCFAYDALERTTATVYAGPNFDGANKYFVYDAATVNGVAMTNAAGNVAEAYTAASINGTKIVDEGFSYTSRGELSDIYESTPNSTVYYHRTATYFPNGQIQTLGGISGGPWTYGLDYKGRISTVSSPSTAIVSSVVRNSSDLPTQVNFGTGDSDTYFYDPNTSRMTGYSFMYGSTGIYDTAEIAWSNNGNLAGLNIADGATATTLSLGGSQVCSYAYDDLWRLASNKCNALRGLQETTTASNSVPACGSSCTSITVPGTVTVGEIVAIDTGVDQEVLYVLSSVPSGSNSVITAHWYGPHASGVPVSLYYDSPTWGQSFSYDAFNNLTKTLPPPTGSLSVSSTAVVVAGSTVKYLGANIAGAGNVYGGYSFTVSGDTNPLNNGTYQCASSGAGYVILSNPSGVTEATVSDTAAVSAVSYLNPPTVWNPGYNQSNNQALGTTADANGNLLNDTFHTYTWNQDNHLLSIDGTISIVYDAYGRKAEIKSSGVYTEPIISPIGNLGMMSQAAVKQYRIPLPGNDLLSGNLLWHADWLQSMRLGTTLNNRAKVFDHAFAPYGEMYAGVAGPTVDINFTGANQDLVPDLFDTPNRELSDNTGRWSSVDPARSSWNGYGYSTNPLASLDPSGQDDDTMFQATFVFNAPLFGSSFQMGPLADTLPAQWGCYAGFGCGPLPYIAYMQSIQANMDSQLPESGQLVLQSFVSPVAGTADAVLDTTTRVLMNMQDMKSGCDARCQKAQGIVPAQDPVGNLPFVVGDIDVAAIKEVSPNVMRTVRQEAWRLVREEDGALDPRWKALHDSASGGGGLGVIDSVISTAAANGITDSGLNHLYDARELMVKALATENGTLIHDMGQPTNAVIGYVQLNNPARYGPSIEKALAQGRAILKKGSK